MRDNFKHVRFPKYTHLGVCDLCTQLRTLRLLASTTREHRVVQQRMRAHTEQHKAERIAYDTRRKNSIRAPGQSTSIIMDMSDKFMCPHKVSYLIVFLLTMYR